MTGIFDGKVALVTAAGAGIGMATAEGFARRGARVMLSDINPETGNAAAERLRGEGHDVRFQRADATKEDDVAALVGGTLAAFGALDVAANIVGDAHRDASGADFHEQSLESWEYTQAVSLRSVFLSMKHEIAHMIGHGGGVVCNVTSLAGMLYVGAAGAAYAAAKAGVVRLTKFAAVSYADRGVRVNCIAPGVTPTEAYNKAGAEMGQLVIDHLLAFQPIKRTIATSEQADVIAWLCSDRAAMVTGHVLPVDGGWTAQ
ncbi:MAG: SDR family oxidoreductase [Sphingomonadales bacterium]|nr:SDR family oxidoreductase [Sphingomonadales bacterium]MDE2570180.1 SDR family oxidoreductase [Sphingomonadales bacterium]